MRPFRIPDQLWAAGQIITPEAYKAMVLQLDPGEDDAEWQARMAVERQFGRDLSAAFDEQLLALLPPDATDEQIRAAVHRVDETSLPVREVLRQSLQQGSDLGVSVVFDTLQNIGLGFDCKLGAAKAIERPTSRRCSVASCACNVRCKRTRRRRRTAPIAAAAPMAGVGKTKVDSSAADWWGAWATMCRMCFLSAAASSRRRSTGRPAGD
jgi:hypothetical protein